MQFSCIKLIITLDICSDREKINRAKFIIISLLKIQFEVCVSLICVPIKHVPFMNLGFGKQKRQICEITIYWFYFSSKSKSEMSCDEQ